MKIEVGCTAAAPPEVAFAAAVDVARWPHFIAGISSVDMLTSGPVAAGTRFRETRLMYGRSASEEMTVARLDPPRAFVLTAASHGTLYRVEHHFASEGEGTRLSVSFEGRPVSLLARLLTPLGLLFLGSVRRQIASDLADLAREAERRCGQPAARGNAELRS